MFPLYWFVVPQSGQIPVDGYEWRAPFHQKKPQGLITSKLKGVLRRLGQVYMDTYISTLVVWYYF